jgi:phospholipid transport system substrate-binding protein
MELHVSRSDLSRRALLLAAALLVAPSALAQGAAVAGAERFIASLGERTVAVLGQAGSDQAARARGIAAVLDETVDIERVARYVLGRHWRGASEAQRAEYVRLFRTYVLGSLSQRLGRYSGKERFVVTGGREAGEQDSLVSTEVVFADGQPPVKVDWRVREGAGRPAVIDVVVEGVSLIMTHRSDFDAIVSQRGLDSLLEEMRARIAATPA